MSARTAFAARAERRLAWDGLLTTAAELGAQAARGEAIGIRAMFGFNDALTRARDVAFPLSTPVATPSAEGFRHLARAFGAAPAVDVPPELGLALVQAANNCVRILARADEAAAEQMRRQFPD